MTRPPRRPVPTLFLGSGGFARPALSRLAAHPSIDLRAVVSAPPRPVGRRQVETRTPVHDLALELCLPVRTPVRLRDAVAIDDLLALDPSLVVLADYGRIVPSDLLGRPHGALNLHPSRLPRHRGATPIPATILAGDHDTGVTLIRMDDGIDTGPIVASERVSVPEGVDAPALEAVLADVAGELLAAALDPWLAGAITPVAQPDAGATMTRPLRRSDGRLDPAAPARLLERAIRAYRPWPGTSLELEAPFGRLVILAGHVADADPADQPGAIVAADRGIALGTSDGRLVLDEVQPAGGRPMSGEAYRRGRPTVVGATVAPVAEPAPASAGTPAAGPA